MSEVIQHLRRGLLQRDGAGWTDGQLLGEFISRRDEAALAALVRRHAPMVWGVCRRVLHNYHDAEDAFQATFPVLVRKAASIASRELVANWLYGVAHQTALKARATAARRKVRERQVAEMPEPAAEPDPWDDLQPLLDHELSRLPENYRAVVVLCDLAGKTRKEAARHLGLPEGTVGSRLARARGMLANRLAQRGVALSGGALGAVLSHGGASASVPPSVIVSTIKAASLFAAGQAAGAITPKVVALTVGVLRTMLLAKLKTATAVLMIMVFLVAGIGTLTHFAMAGEREPKSDEEQLQGTWVIVSAEIGGRKGSADEIKQTSPRLVIKGDKFSVEEKGRVTTEGSFKLDASAKPKAVEVTEGGGKSLGIYELDGDSLKVCLGGKQPRAFTTRAGSGEILLVCKRFAAEPKEAGIKKDVASLRGKWTLSLAIVEGKKATDKAVKDESRTFTFGDDKFAIMSRHQTVPGEATYKLDPTTTPPPSTSRPSTGRTRGSYCWASTNWRRTRSPCA